VDELQVVVALTSEAFYDVDDTPTYENDVCRYWAALEDSPVPNYRVWVVFNRKPKDNAEAEATAREHFGTEEDAFDDESE